MVASAALGSGALTGKYASGGRPGRIAGELDAAHLRPALEAAVPLRVLAERLAATPAALALAFPLANANVASVLFGATRPEQVTENVEAAALLSRLGDSDLAELRGIGRSTSRRA